MNGQLHHASGIIHAAILEIDYCAILFRGPCCLELSAEHAMLRNGIVLRYCALDESRSNKLCPLRPPAHLRQLDKLSDSADRPPVAKLPWGGNFWGDEPSPSGGRLRPKSPQAHD